MDEPRRRPQARRREEAIGEVDAGDERRTAARQRQPHPDLRPRRARLGEQTDRQGRPVPRQVNPRPPTMRCLFACLLSLSLPLSLTAADPVVVKLWPGKAPGETKDIGAEKYQENKPGDTIKQLTNVNEPTISVYPAPKEKATGAAVLVAPGGGYSILAIEHEGTDVCTWLNSIGVTAVLLKYRVAVLECQAQRTL